MDRTVGFGPADRGSIPRRLVKFVGSDSMVESRNGEPTNDLQPTTNDLSNLSKHQIENLIRRLSKIKKKKYLRNNDRKYGNLNKGFTEAELKQFFKCCRNLRANLSFQLMANLGLRVGEVVRIKIEDLDFFKNKIKINTEKAGTVDFMHLHMGVRKLLHDWVQKFQEDIIKHNGFLLFPDSKSQSDNNHISPNWLRKEFRDVCFLAGLNENYGVSEESYESHRERKLYRLTTHSLRHYFITKVYKNSKNPLFTQRLGRHRDFKSTQTYININQEEIDNVIKKTFEEENIIVNESEVEEFITFFKMWKMMKGKD